MNEHTYNVVCANFSTTSSGALPWSHARARTVEFSSLGQLAYTRAFTLIELLITLAIATTIMFIAVPAYSGYVEEAKLSQVRGDFGLIELKIERFRSDNNGSLPGALAQLGPNLPQDPWGNPYQYFNIEDSGPGNGQLRKDKNLVPINSDFDLYSMGKDGDSKPPLTAKASRDDIVRANNGGYVGYASEY